MWGVACLLVRLCLVDGNILEAIRINTVGRDVTKECAIPTMRNPDIDLETIQKVFDRLLDRVDRTLSELPRCFVRVQLEQSDEPIVTDTNVP
ncbi:hypothetical protein F5888DRAFT_717824 [Russula emetica]|nr:hypothetical protein F5888DRAFT_717824 [Russula emetica]